MQRLRGVSVELLAGIIILTLLTITVMTLFIMGYSGSISYKVSESVSNSLSGLIQWLQIQ